MKFINKIKRFFIDFASTFKNGNIWTKLSYFIQGTSSFKYKQYHRGIIYLGSQIMYWIYMFTSGFHYLSKLNNLGDQTQCEVWNPDLEIFEIIQGDNSMLILLFGVATIFLTTGALLLYFINVSNARENEEVIKEGKEVNGLKDDLRNMVDKNFHRTTLSLPIVTISAFIIIPMVFMMLIAFTNYDRHHQPPGHLFTWVGFENFANLFGQNSQMTKTFIYLLIWTLIWAVVATFANFILGLILSLIINQKGIKFKSYWRTMFVVTIAVPQFVSLLVVANLLSNTGSVNTFLQVLGFDMIPFLTDGTTAKFTVIIVNLWVGIPFTMLSTTGILMNIPKDLYEAATIDGASKIQQFTKITMPYMLHVMTPYLITTFIGNINNFNVIYLLTGDSLATLDLYKASEVDLLVTWLFKLTQTEQEYGLASCIGIMIFAVTAVLSLVVFNKSGAIKREDELK